VTLLAVWQPDVRGKWPSIALTESAFRAHLARLHRPGPEFPLDAYLAAACAAGDPAAIRALDEEFVARVPSFVGRIDGSNAFAAEIAQALRVRLLVGENGAPPRIGLYTGEVPLGAWIRVIVVRLALNAKRSAALPGYSAVTTAEEPVGDPELEYLQTQYREPFARAFRHALELLDRSDRTILRLHYLDGLNIEGIAKIFRIHRATVARRLVRVRADVLGHVKVHLAKALGTELEDVDSVLGALASEFHVTLSRMLADSKTT
jgi:RNA polymerase sigma-70 factor (ECF subfamily)